MPRETGLPSVSSKSAQLLNAFARVVRPTDRIWPDQWADRNRRFPATSGKPGFWDTSDSPQTRGPSRAVMRPGIARVGWVMPSQNGKTAAAINVALAIIDTKSPEEILDRERRTAWSARKCPKDQELFSR